MPAEALEAWQRPVPGGMTQRHIDEGLVLYGNKARVRRLVQVGHSDNAQNPEPISRTRTLGLTSIIVLLALRGCSSPVSTCAQVCTFAAQTFCLLS